MTFRQKLRAIVVCAELCRQHKGVKLMISDDVDPNGEQGGRKLLAQDADLENLHRLRSSVTKAMGNKQLSNCTSVGNSLSSQNSGMFYLVAVYD